MIVSKNIVLSAVENFYAYHKHKILALPSFAMANDKEREQIIHHEKAMKVYVEAWQKYL